MPLSPEHAAASAAHLPGLLAVLVLDDQRFDRHKLNRLCSTLPMQCDVAQADSLRAFNTQLDSSEFDLIFVDYSLPDGSGFDALDLIRKSERNSDTTSIMITAYDDDALMVEAMSRGCSDYITKDALSTDSFKHAVTSALGKSAHLISQQSQTYARKEVEAVLNSFARQCLGDIKPMVARMIRQLRDMRDTPGLDAAQSRRRRETVEATCMDLRDFLEELEKHSAATLMKDLLAKAKPSGQATPVLSESGFADRLAPPRARGSTSEGPRRPPSPFSRSTH